MKKILFILIISHSILFADLSKMINLPKHSTILSLTFRYISTDGNIQTQKLMSKISLRSNTLLLSQHKKDGFLAKIDINNISRINSLVIEYIDKSHNKFFKPIYYNLALISRGMPLYVIAGNPHMHNTMTPNKNNMPLMFNEEDDSIIDGFTLNKSNYPSYQKMSDNSMEKTKVMKFKKYNLSYIKDVIHPIVLNGVDIAKKEKHFCTIPIRDNIFYFMDKKSLFVIFKDFELNSGMYIANNKVTIRFEQENRFKTCVLKNINKNIMKMSAFHKDDNNGEVWFNVHFSSEIKSVSIVYPKEESDIMSYNEELKDIVVYKIEY